MALTIYALRDYPNDFPVTKIDVPWEDCAFFLDFSRPLERLRWLGVLNKWVGITTWLLVPIIHSSEEVPSGLVIGVGAADPYFKDVQKLWKKHYGSNYGARRGLVTELSEQWGTLQIIADFGRHFPVDGAPPGSTPTL